MRYSSPEWIGKNIFSVKKNRILNPEQTLRNHKIFSLKESPEYLYWLFHVLSKQITGEMKTLQVQVYIQQWFHDEQGAKFI